MDRGVSKPFAYSRSVGVFEIDTAADIEQALWLFRLSYDRLHGARAAKILALVTASVGTGRSPEAVNESETARSD